MRKYDDLNNTIYNYSRLTIGEVHKMSDREIRQITGRR